MECGVWVKADQYNGRVVRVANSFVFKEPVYNYSGDFNFFYGTKSQFLSNMAVITNSPETFSRELPMR